jgi:hypothetical protein
MAKRTPDDEIRIFPRERRKIAMCLIQSALKGESDGNYIWSLRRHGAWLRRQLDVQEVEALDPADDYDENDYAEDRDEA